MHFILNNRKTIRHLFSANLKCVSNLNQSNFKQSSRIRLAAKTSSNTSYVFLIFPLSAFCLGSWQVYRRRWKLALIDDLERRTAEPAIDLPTDYKELKSLEYRKVKVKGRFDNSNEIYITPRALNQSKHSTGGGLISSQRKETTGAWVITPFVVTDRDIRILVNRGWVSRSNIDPNSRLNGQIDSEIELTGVVRLTEKRQPFGFKNKENGIFWSYRDIEAMANMLNTEQIFIDADLKSTIAGGPVGGQTRVTLRNEHMSYIITWYGLCIVTFLIWYAKMFKKKGRL